MKKLEFMSKFKPETRCIKEFKYWIVCIREKQVNLGSSVILLKRETPSVANILPDEAAEFPEVVKWFEGVCTNKFNAVKFNYLIMMMKDPYVHYHAIPRYDNEIEMFGKVWEDTNTLKGFGTVESLDEELLMKIKEYMKN